MDTVIRKLEFISLTDNESPVQPPLTVTVDDADALSLQIPGAQNQDRSTSLPRSSVTSPFSEQSGKWNLSNNNFRPRVHERNLSQTKAQRRSHAQTRAHRLRCYQSTTRRQIVCAVCSMVHVKYTHLPNAMRRSNAATRDEFARMLDIPAASIDRIRSQEGTKLAQLFQQV
jgi:hypothetical protein